MGGGVVLSSQPASLVPGPFARSACHVKSQTRSVRELTCVAAHL